MDVEVIRESPESTEALIRLTCECGTESTYEGYVFGHHVCPGCQKGWEVETLIFFAKRPEP